MFCLWGKHIVCVAKTVGWLLHHVIIISSLLDGQFTDAFTEILTDWQKHRAMEYLQPLFLF